MYHTHIFMPAAPSRHLILPKMLLSQRIGRWECGMRNANAASVHACSCAEEDSPCVSLMCRVALPVLPLGVQDPPPCRPSTPRGSSPKSHSPTSSCSRRGVCSLARTARRGRTHTIDPPFSGAPRSACTPLELASHEELSPWLPGSKAHV